MSGVPGPEEVVAVVTSFNPGDSLVRVVASAVGQLGRVVVVDDGSTAATADRVLAECVALGCTVVRHGDNRGIAAALNSGVARAISAAAPARAVMTLDQDSALPDGYVAATLAAWRSAAAAGLRVGMVGSEHVDGLPDQAVEVRRGVLVGGEPIQSGLLVPATVLTAVGGFDESLFIDGVDTDFFLRCRDAGYAVVIAPGTTLGHHLGSRHALTVLGRPVTVRGRPVSVTRSASFRYYYLVRNRIVLVRRHGRRHARWAAGQVVGLLGHLVLVQVLAPGRRERAWWVLHGIRDGLRGTGGAAPVSRRPSAHH